MGDQPKWIEVAKKTPAWVSGAIGLATGIIGFVLLLQGNVDLGVTVLGILVTVLLLYAFAYVAFAKTPPLVKGGRGVYRFEKYRTWALLGLGLVAGIATSALLFEESRGFIVASITGREDAAAQGEGRSGREAAGAQEEGSDGSFSNECFEAYFATVGDGRVGTLENGATAQVVLESDQTKGEVAGLHFTEFGRSVGAVTYQVFPDSNLFRIESLVDGGCQELAQYGGRSLPSADPIEISLGEEAYILDMVYDGGAVYASFRQFSP